MKITYSNYRAVALWHWDVASGNPVREISRRAALDVDQGDDGSDLDGLESDGDDARLREGYGGDDDDEEDNYGPCAICHSDYDSACPTCKVPGDDCPLIWGKCTHCFHMHCLLKWLDAPSSNETCPMDRRPWENASGAPAPVVAAVDAAMADRAAAAAAQPGQGGAAAVGEAPVQGGGDPVAPPAGLVPVAAQDGAPDNAVPPPEPDDRFALIVDHSGVRIVAEAQPVNQDDESMDMEE